MNVNRFVMNKKRRFEETKEPAKKKFKKMEESEDEEEDMEPFPINPMQLESKQDDFVYQLDNHIYFTTDVSMKSINKLSKLIHNSNKEFEILESTVSHMAETKPKPIYLHISSMGGDLFAGFRAVDVIQNSKIPIYTVIEGYAISAASLMYLAGKRKFMTKNSFLLIHQLTNYHGGGDAETFEKSKDEFTNNQLLMNQLYDFYVSSSNTKLTKKKVEEILKHDLYWNYDTCSKYGLVDELFGVN